MGRQSREPGGWPGALSESRSRGAGRRRQDPEPADTAGISESVKVGEQNLYTRAKELVGDRDPREHEFSIQMRAIDADKSGTGLGLAVLVALCGSLLGRNTRGGTIVVGSLNLGGSIEMVPNPVRIAELAVDKQAQTLLMPVACRRQLAELPDDMWTRISIEFYKDSGDAVFKALTEYTRGTRNSCHVEWFRALEGFKDGFDAPKRN